MARSLKPLRVAHLSRYRIKKWEWHKTYQYSRIVLQLGMINNTGLDTRAIAAVVPVQIAVHCVYRLNGGMYRVDAFSC